MIINSFQKFCFLLFQKLEQLINISPHSLMMINTVNTQFSFVKFWFTDQVSKALKDNVDLTIIWVALIKMRYIDPRYSKYVKGYSSLSVAGKFGHKYEKKN